MKRTKFQRQISASSALSFAYKNLAKKNRPECEGFPLQCIFFCLFEFIPSIFPFSLTELTLSVLLSSVFFLHWTMQTVDDARSDCFQLLMVVMILLLCACCHVDDVHSTYSDFIIMIIVLNSNLLNNICHVCHLLFCHTLSHAYALPKNESNVISFGSTCCLRQHHQLYLHRNAVDAL